MADDPGDTRRVTSLDAVKPAKRAATTVRVHTDGAKPVKPAGASARRTKPVLRRKPVKPAGAATRRVKPAAADTRVPPTATSAPAGGNKPVDEVLRLVGELARHVFGADGDKKAEQAIEFLRRRLTGDYEVDAFGFDEQLNEAVLLPLLRPLYRRWFRVEVRGIEQSRRRARR